MSCTKKELLDQIATFLNVKDVDHDWEKYLKRNEAGGFVEDNISPEVYVDIFGNRHFKARVDFECVPAAGLGGLVCKHCKNDKDFAEDMGEIICKHCGLVLIDHVINETYVGIVFDKDGAMLEDAPAVGDAPKKNLPSWYNFGIMSPVLRSDVRKHGKSTSDEHKVKQILKFTDEIKEVSTLFQLSDVIQTTAVDMFSEIRRFRERIHKTSFPYILYACLRKSIDMHVVDDKKSHTCTGVEKLHGFCPTNRFCDTPMSFCKTMAECIVRGGYVPECHLCGQSFNSLQKQRDHKCTCIPPWIQNIYVQSLQSKEIEKLRTERMLRKRKLVADFSLLS